MKIIPSISFLLGAILCGIVWALLWPRSPSTRSSPSSELFSSRHRQTKPALSELLSDLENAPTSQDRLKASLRFHELPASSIPATMEALHHNGKLTLAQKLLFFRWGYHDGPAAARWAWLNLRDKGQSQWQDAWNEISSGWSASDPPGLADWIISHHQHSPPGDLDIRDITLSQAGTSESPLLDVSSVRKAVSLLLPSNPRAAFRVILSTKRWDFLDNSPAKLLATPAQIHEALSCFDNLDQLQPDSLKDHDFLAVSLFLRWREIDPEGFSRSPYAHLLPAAPAVVPSNPPPPATSTQASWLSEFSNWKKQSSSRPDMSGWSLAKIRAWEDLEALHSSL